MVLLSELGHGLSNTQYSICEEGVATIVVSVSTVSVLIKYTALVLQGVLLCCVFGIGLYIFTKEEVGGADRVLCNWDGVIA